MKLADVGQGTKSRSARADVAAGAMGNWRRREIGGGWIEAVEAIVWPGRIGEPAGVKWRVARCAARLSERHSLVAGAAIGTIILVPEGDAANR
jgi:hypothetical protein